MVKTFRTSSHRKKRCRPFTKKGFLLIFLFLLALTALALPPFGMASDSPLPGGQAVTEIERLNNEALRCFITAKRQEAIALWKKADDLARNAKVPCPAHVEVLLNLGQAYFKMGSEYYPLAEAALNRVIDIDPDRWDTYMTLGDICYDDGDPDCAMGYYDLSLRLNPGHKRADMASNRMDGVAQYSRSRVSHEGKTSTVYQRKYVYSYLLDEEQRYYYFYVTYNRDSNLTRIDIVREGEKRIHQTFKYGDFDCGPPPGEVGLLMPADFNAHGNMDLKLLCMRGDGSRAGYLYYIYNRRKSMFIPFSGGMLPDSIPGPDAQEIRIFNSYADAGKVYVESFYRITGGKLVLVREVKQTETAQREGKRFYKKTTRERSQETMAVVSESLIEAGAR